MTFFSSCQSALPILSAINRGISICSTSPAYLNCLRRQHLLIVVRANCLLAFSRLKRVISCLFLFSEALRCLALTPCLKTWKSVCRGEGSSQPALSGDAVCCWRRWQFGVAAGADRGRLESCPFAPESAHHRRYSVGSIGTRRLVVVFLTQWWRVVSTYLLTMH